MGLTRRPSPFQYWMQWIPSSVVGRWLLPRILHTIDQLLYWLTGGRRTLTSLLAGLPILFLTARGAKSGAPRTVPLVGISQGENIILIASNWGQKHLPGWYYNLRANPTASIAVDGISREYSVREIIDETEYARLWNCAVAVYKGYNVYRAIAGRRIPMFWLEPK